MAVASVLAQSAAAEVRRAAGISVDITTLARVERLLWAIPVTLLTVGAVVAVFDLTLSILIAITTLGWTQLSGP